MQRHTVRRKLPVAAAVSALGLILGSGYVLAEQHEAQAQTQQQQGATQELQPVGIVGFETLDLDKSGTVTLQELETVQSISQQLSQQFGNIDMNSDETIDQAEFAQFEQAARPGAMPQDEQMQDSGGQMQQDDQMQQPLPQ